MIDEMAMAYSVNPDEIAPSEIGQSGVTLYLSLDLPVWIF